MPSRVVGMTRSRGVRVAEGEWRLVLTETVFRSEDVPAAERFECWRDLLRQLHAPLDLDSEHRSDFRAEQRVLELGEVSVWPTRFQPVRFLRTPKLIRQSDPEGVHLSLPLDGVLRVRRGDRETAYGPDSLCLVDTSRPLDLRAGDSFSPRPHIGVGLEVPKALLPLTWDRIDRLTACRLSAREGFGGLLAQLLHQLAEGTAAYRPDDGPRLGTIVVDLLSSLFAHVVDAEASLTPETRRRALLLRIRAFALAHLGDPGLTPSALAAAHHISIGHLHRLFQDEPRTPAAWIRHQRLEHARHDLADPAQHATPVHAIAARWGFPRAADFTRAFRAAYGSPPRDYRHASSRGDTAGRTRQ